jgi:hypothetical protein
VANVKHILEPRRHTDEDELAWAEVTLRAAQWSPRLAGALYTYSLLSDGRDADLMYRAERLKAQLDAEGMDVTHAIAWMACTDVELQS